MSHIIGLAKKLKEVRQALQMTDAIERICPLLLVLTEFYEGLLTESESTNDILIFFTIS